MDSSKIKFVEYFKPKNWLSVIRAWINRDKYPLHIIEQLHSRYLECGPCYNNGSCLHCGCSTREPINKFSDLKATCSDGKWEEVKSKEEWEARKKKYGIKFLINYNI